MSQPVLKLIFYPYIVEMEEDELSDECHDEECDDEWQWSWT